MKKSFLSILFVLIFCSFSFGQEPPTKPPTSNGMGTGQGSGIIEAGRDDKNENEIPKPVVLITPPNTIRIRILSKPRPNYTDLARKNGVEGIVRLRITFLATGEIGAISPVATLPDGLTEQAIAAARKVKFKPEMRNGVPVSVTKQVEYNFSILYEEDDEALTQNAEILEMPEAEYPQESNLQIISGKVKVSIVLKSNGNAEVAQINTDLPKEFIQKATEAVAKIKFKPAVHKNGNAVTQRKNIEYEFSKQKN